eukprot:CAMPEP_0205811438 /NCGR_PEP_ID=MMETSP0205-20121125/15626_1 /ASSEMBLY_ACC=CAM_ASM_000278 /TAXON_ID=36767 /ORGANISM="Euplotes focardii, Strain TN1" /LENGTH=94 /DNA_ID=CAMNT_0053090585 /DNA_START=1 /DNA_END=282 /DNA_ORIENTATION=-
MFRKQLENRHKSKMEEIEKEQEKEYTPKKTTPLKVKKRMSKKIDIKATKPIPVIKKKSNDATFITKKESFEMPVMLDTPNDQDKQDKQRESLKK